MPTQTKEQIVLRALRRAGLASSAMLLAPEPESVQDALTDLEDMMAEWEADGTTVAYRYTSAPTPQPSEESGLPDWAVAPVAHNLACRLLLDNSRPVADELSTLAFEGLRKLKARRVEIPMLQRRNDMPRGAGNGGAGSPFAGARYYDQQRDDLTDDNGQALDL